jgi:hypothetical protein
MKMVSVLRSVHHQVLKKKVRSLNSYLRAD